MPVDRHDDFACPTGYRAGSADAASTRPVGVVARALRSDRDRRGVGGDDPTRRRLSTDRLPSTSRTQDSERLVTAGGSHVSRAC